MKETILFLGGGYTTIWAYKQICKSRNIINKIGKGELELVVICDREHHYYHGFTGDVIAGVMPEEAICTPLHTLLPLAQLIDGTVTAVSPFMNSVKYIANNGQTKEIKYSQLVVGCGTVDKETAGHALKVSSIKKPNGLFVFQRQLENVLVEYQLMKEINPHQEKEHIVLLGTGFTSIEIATNMRDYIHKTYGDLVHITIINSGRTSSILKEWQQQQPRLVKYAEKMLHKKGIRLLNDSIKEATTEGIETSNGTFLRTQLVINATGQKPVELKGLKHLTLNKENKVETNPYLNAAGYTNIWCGGDIALVKKPFGSGNCPPNALWAIMQGTRIGKNIRRTLQGKPPGKFSFRGLGQTAAFGKGQGALELFGLSISGWPAYVIRLGFFFYFFPAKTRLIKLCWQANVAKERVKPVSIPNETSHIIPLETTESIETKKEEILETA